MGQKTGGTEDSKSWYGVEDWGRGEVLREWGGQGYLQYWGASKFHPELSAV